MSRAIEDLRHEHEAILFTLEVLEKMMGLIGAGALTDPADPGALLVFLKEFVDKCHHGKEELILFPALVRAGIAKEGGPIGVMLSEHAEGREHIAKMETALRAQDGLKSFALEARDYIALLKLHIIKENTILFPMGEQVLDEAGAKEIYEAFEEHEERVIGAGRHEELHAMLDQFDEKYLKAHRAD
jgi:hemerythrin-like domain-containing protein